MRFRGEPLNLISFPCGQSSRQIAEILGVSTRTIESHRQNIMDKLGLRSATALANYANEQGLL